MCMGAMAVGGLAERGVGGLIPSAFAAQQRQANKKSAASKPGYGGVFTAENPPPMLK